MIVSAKFTKRPTANKKQEHNIKLWHHQLANIQCLDEPNEKPILSVYIYNYIL